MATQRRMVYAKMLSSHKLCQMPITARWLFIGTILLADDNGRLNGDPRYLRGQIFSYDQEVTVEEVEKMIDDLVNSTVIHSYEVDGSKYLHHPKWSQYQHLRKDRMSRSQIPKPTCCKIAINKISIAGSGLPREIADEVYQRDGEVCRYCKKTTRPFTIDHILPRSKGGSDELDNLTISCVSCNLSKGDKLLSEWQPNDNQPTFIRQPKLSKLKLNQVNLSKGNEATPTPKDYAIQFFEIVDSRGSEFNQLIERLASKGISSELARTEVLKFTSYWTELNSTGKQQRWQKEKTFEVQKRLNTWFSRAGKWSNTAPKARGFVM